MSSSINSDVGYVRSKSRKGCLFPDAAVSCRLNVSSTIGDRRSDLLTTCTYEMETWLLQVEALNNSRERLRKDQLAWQRDG